MTGSRPPQSPAEDVILVDVDDRQIGTEEKLSAHRRGVLHRAFSVMVWDGGGRLLLQQRALGKYHSGGLWTNTCCGHPRPGEDVAAAAVRRLEEEMGFRAQLTALGTFQYRAELDHDLIENELVHVFSGVYSGAIAADPLEVESYAWSTPADIARDAAASPERFTAWFKKYLDAGWPVVPPPF